MGEMQTESDTQLLRAYAECGAEAAFTELVRRHTDLVYSAAWRQVESSDIAREIAQGVFIGLARRAQELVPRLAAEASLAGWLCRSARNLSLNHRRDEFRRQTRERHAMEQLASIPDAAPDWEHLRRVLDDAMSELDEVYCDAVVLRFFQNRDFRAVGAAMGVNDDTAQKRVARALEKLRELLAQRGIRTTATALSVAITANAVQAAPAGLALTISAAALAGTAATTSTVIATTTKSIAKTTLQKTLVTATVAALAGAGAYQARQAAHLRDQVQTLQQQQAPLAEQIQQLQHECDEATNRMADLKGELARANKNNLELMKLRANATQVQTVATVESDPAFQKASEWMAKEARLREQFEMHPNQWIPEMKYLSNEEWLDQARRADLDTTSGIRCAMSNVRVAATYKFARNISKALTKYLIAHSQQLPESTSQLSTYFQPSITDADTILARYEMINREAQTNSTYEGAAIIERSVVDRIESPVLIGAKTVVSAPQPSWPSVIPNELMPVVNAYKDANNHEGFLSVYDLEPYATTPEQKEALNKFMKAATMPH